MKNEMIKWISKEVLIANIKPTEKNYKIRNALGRERLQQSLKSFGLAGNVVCNWIGNFNDLTKLMLIDGNSRLEQVREAGDKKVWVSVPSRKLSAKEFQEMSAMFDLAKAGDVDMERIQGDLGKTADFYKKWNLMIPKNLLDTLGAKKVNQYQKEKDLKKVKATAAKVLPDQDLNDMVMVQLLFSHEENESFRLMEDKLMKMFNTKSTKDTVLKAFKKLTGKK